MKILVTGSTGYIAGAFAEEADLISVRNDAWRGKTFAGYDAVLHTAGLAHVRENRRNQYDYFVVNRDLALDVAKKAKADGVPHFVFLSSISVYGLESGHITASTPALPKTNYGRSKLAAESLIAALADDSFRVAILRPPMVYGAGCPGNYARLRKLVALLPFFPSYKNARSVISIESLHTQINAVIYGQKSGIFHPCDPVPLSTAEMAAAIAQEQGRRLRQTRVFNIPIRILTRYSRTFAKIFGSLTIDAEIQTN